MAGDLLGAIGDSINQDKGFIFGLANNAISYSQSKKAQRRAFEYAKLLQQQQYDLSIRGYKEAPTAQRTGLETAGYNPMLALGKVGDGVSVAGGTPVNANATESADLAGAAATIQGIKNQTDQTAASTDEMYANADKAKAEKATILARLPFVPKQAKADYIKTQMEAAKFENDIHYQNEYINYLKSSLTNAKEIALIEAEAKKYSADSSSGAIRYSADRSYNASTYSADKGYGASIFESELRHPWSYYGRKVWLDGSGPSRYGYGYNYPDPWRH